MLKRSHNLQSKKNRLKTLLKKNALKFGDITLSSGVKSNYYIDARMITLDPEGANLIGTIILDLIKDTQADAIGGITMGADPIVSAVSTLSYQEGKPIKAFIVRKEPKKHGTEKWIEGPLVEGDKVIIVDDVVTTGNSILKAIEKVKEYNCKVEKVISIVDRGSQFYEKMKGKSYKYEPIFTLEDLALR